MINTQNTNSSPNDNTSPMSDPPKLKSSFESKPQKSSFDNYASTLGNRVITNTSLGKSTYDEGFNIDAQFNDADPEGSINEARAQSQSWGTKAAAGLARTGVKVGIEVAKMPGFVLGAVAAPFVKDGEGWETAVNNSWIKGLNNLNENINNEILPVYVKKAVSEGNLWDNISSIDFWATDGADGVGYILSMMAPGAGFKALGMGQKIMGATTKGLAFTRYGGNTEKAVQAMTNLGLKAETFDVAGTAIANTLFEASAEAGGAMENFEASKDQFVNRLIISENRTREDAEKIFNEQKALLGRDIFVTNVGILAGPNLIMSKMIWGKSAAKQLVNTEAPSLLGKVANRGKNVLGATISEGFIEEAGQMTVENMYTNKAKRGTLTNSIFDDTSLSEVVDNYLDTISSTDGQKAMFLGAFLGGGMTAYSGAKSDKANREQTNSLINLTEEKINSFNKAVETDIYKRDENGAIVYNYNNKPTLDPIKVVEQAKALQFSEMESQLFEMAASQGNLEVVDRLKQRAVDQLITPFITQGEMGINALKQYLEETSKAEEIQISDKNNNNKSFIEGILQKAKYMQSQYEAYDSFSRELINLNNPNATVEETTDYYNSLASVYINLKGQEYTEKKNLKKLNEDKSRLLGELGETEISTELNTNFIEGKTEDIYKYDREETDPRLKLINNKIERSKKILDNLNKTVNQDIWDSKKVNEAFNEKIKSNEAIREEAAKEPELEATLAEIEEIQTPEELDKIKETNPEVVNKIAERKEQIVEEDLAKDEVIDSINEDTAEVKKVISQEPVVTETGEIVEPTPTPEKPVITNDEFIGDETSADEDTPASNNENLSESIDKQLTKLQPGAKVISTIQKTGEKLPFVSQEFLDYERSPRDKSKDVVGFAILNPEVENKNWSNAIEMYENKDFSNLDFLYKHLPLEMVIPVSFYGVSAPLETITESTGANKVFREETLPLRKAIIDALANGSRIEDISSNIVKQFPGQLKVQPQIENTDGTRLTPENNIRELQIFQGLNDAEFIKEFVKRAYYVNYSGQLVNVVDKNKVKASEHKGKGEIFLEIPQNNGKPFMLKLNFKRIDFSKAEAVYEILKSLSNIRPTVENPNIQTMLIEDFINDLPEDIKESVFNSLSDEIDLIFKTYKNGVERTIEKLLDLIVFQKSENSKTKLRVDPQGNIEMGSLASVSKIRRIDLDSSDSKYAIMEFLNKKKHNVLITKDDKFQFNDVNYINYLLDNKIISTNAVVNEPTFQGYSNIYLNRDIKVKNQPKVENNSNQSQIDEIKANIELKINNLPDNLLFITHITSESKGEVIYNSNLLMPAGVSSTTGIVNKTTLKEILYNLAEGKSPHRGYLDMFIGAIDHTTLENSVGKSLQDKLENYLDENFIEDVAKNQLPSSLNIGYFKNGVLTTKYDVEIKSLNNSITPSLNENGSDPNTVAAIQKLLNKSKKVSENKPLETKEESKVETNFDFDSLDTKNKMILLTALRKELGVTLSDEQIKRLKSDPKSLYNEMIEIARSKNTNIDNIIKRCG